MKKIFVYLFFIVISWFLSCVHLEGEMPEQEFMVAFDKGTDDRSFSSRIKGTDIDTIRLSEKLVVYDVHIPALRWGQGIFLGCTFTGGNPETNSNLFFVSKGGIELYSISMAEIKTLGYFIIDSKQVFILPADQSQ